MEDCVSDASSRMNGNHLDVYGDSEFHWTEFHWMPELCPTQRKRDEDYMRRLQLMVKEALREMELIQTKAKRNLDCMHGQRQRQKEDLREMELIQAKAKRNLDCMHGQRQRQKEDLLKMELIQAKVKRNLDCMHRQRQKEMIKFLRGLVSDFSSKVMGLVPSLNEIDNYVRPLQRQVEELTEHKKLLKAGNKQLNDEITLLKEIIGVLGYQIRHLSVSLQDHHGTNSEAVDKTVSMELSASHPISNGDAATIDILMKLDADEVSTVEFSDFTGLDGERKKVGKYSVPPSLVPTAENIISVYGDVSASCNMNPRVAESIYIMFCASIKEMSDLRLEQVTEDLILKWRDAIKDASRVSFNVAFAMEHLKKIACAYIVLMEFLKLEDVAFRIFDFESESSAATEEINDNSVSLGEMLLRKKQDMQAMAAAHKKLIDDFMVFIDAIDKNDMEKAPNFDEKKMMDTILTVMNSDRGVVDNMGNTSAAHMDVDGHFSRGTTVKDSLSL